MIKATFDVCGASLRSGVCVWATGVFVSPSITTAMKSPSYVCFHEEEPIVTTNGACAAYPIG